MATGSATILFDGVCNLCNGFVQFVIEHDPHGYFKFAALQSEIGQQTLQQHKMPTQQFSSFLLLENGKLYTRSSAALRVFRRLSGAWPLLYGFMILPAFLRDAVYDLVARNRYRWFGQQESCMLPTPELKARFL
ncbi:thiol-disulfide oxidoreductase DCC family protein [Rufibacter roseus]|uniref:Thiol-disulfide oxidoreductase DCC family protein n=1 Tax=Rufibacter roseus TaxID=1567108 RepID=A0ABW2DKG4_9BACT|nr:thiol-disulfide oxidoreductase DCC family protein [Rufibacter roseus]